MEDFEERASEVLAQIAQAYFNSTEVFSTSGEIAAVLRAHAEDYEEDGRVGEVMVLRMCAELLDTLGDAKMSHRKRLEAGRGALDLIQFYRRAQ